MQITRTVARSNFITFGRSVPLNRSLLIKIIIDNHTKDVNIKMKNFIKKNFTDLLWIIIVFELILFILPTKWYENDLVLFTSYLLQFSAIFSVIAFTVIISKVFSQRQENSRRKEEIVKLSNKVSDLRRIAKILIDNDGFWPSELKRIMNNDYADLTNEILENQNLQKDSVTDNLKMKYIDDSRINESIANLFVALRTLRGDVTEHGLFLYTNYDFDYTYRFDIINVWTENHIANNLWYVFDNKYSSLNKIIHIEEIRSDSQNEILHLAKKISNEKYSDYTTLTNKLLSRIGTDFDSFYFERLRYLLFENRPVLPKSVRFSFNIMLIIMISGALLPIYFQTIKLYNPLILKIVFSVFIFSISIFLIKFKKILRDELIV